MLVAFLFGGSGEDNIAQAAENGYAIHVVDPKTGENKAYEKPEINDSLMLKASEKYNENAVSPVNVIGNDDRVLISNTSDYPYTTMARITVTYQDGTSQSGSGAMIGSRLVATAGHVLINDNLSHAKSIIMEFGLYGSSRVYKTSSFSSYIYYGDYKGYDPNTDYGFIVLPDNSVSNVTGYMGVRTACDPYQAIYAAGYPGGNPYLFLCAGNVTSFTDELLIINADFSAGQSGGPVYVMYQGVPYLMGNISGNSGEINYVRRLDVGLYTWLVENGYR